MNNLFIKIDQKFCRQINSMSQTATKLSAIGVIHNNANSQCWENPPFLFNFIWNFWLLNKLSLSSLDVNPQNGTRTWVLKCCYCIIEASQKTCNFEFSPGRNFFSCSPPEEAKQKTSSWLFIRPFFRGLVRWGH